MPELISPDCAQPALRLLSACPLRRPPSLTSAPLQLQAAREDSQQRAQRGIRGGSGAISWPSRAVAAAIHRRWLPFQRVERHRRPAQLTHFLSAGTWGHTWARPAGTGEEERRRGGEEDAMVEMRCGRRGCWWCDGREGEEGSVDPIDRYLCSRSPSAHRAYPAYPARCHPPVFHAS
jgi:hypothetical protein